MPTDSNISGAFTVGSKEVLTPVSVRESTLSFANFVVPLERAADLLRPTGLRPAPILPGRTIVALSFVDYIDGDLGSYHELAVAFVVKPFHSPNRNTLGEMAALARGEVAVYMHAVPVDSDFACQAGIEIWGLPKFVADISLSNSSQGTHGRLVVTEKKIVELTTRPAGSRHFGPATFDVYTFDDQTLRVFPSTFSGEKLGVGLGGASLWIHDAHPIGQTLKQLGLPKRALTSGCVGKASAQFGSPRMVER